jgi:Transposase domain (DUF772)
MGERRVGQDALFYEFSLERHVPADHMLRSIDRFVDLSGVRAHLQPFYSEIGRPSIDPELMIRMLLVGYCFGIRSERRLCEEVHLNLAYRWFSLGGHGSSTPFFRAYGLGGAQKGSGFFACSTPRRRRTGWVEKDSNGLALPRDQPAYADPSQPTMRARPTPRTLPGAPSAAAAEPGEGVLLGAPWRAKPRPSTPLRRTSGNRFRRSTCDA